MDKLLKIAIMIIFAIFIKSEKAKPLVSYITKWISSRICFRNSATDFIPFDFFFDFEGN